MIAEILLYLFIGLAAGSAAGILITRSVLHGALLLIVCLVSIAGIYLLLQAEFLAVTQIIIYAGGVIVLIIFGIMLTPAIAGKIQVAPSRSPGLGIGLSVLLLAGLLYGTQSLTPLSSFTTEPGNHVSAVGQLLFTRYAAAFEVAGLLLLVCLVAAAVIATHSLTKKQP